MDTLPESNNDLIDDIWQRIFESVDYKLRISLFQVCKRWKSIASSPLCWTSLDVWIDPFGCPSFCQFVTKCCSLATKIRIDVHESDHCRQILRALVSLRHLRYLKICITKTSFGESDCPSFPRPDWSNLVYFNLTVPHIVTGEEWDKILEGTPNLEELYFIVSDLPQGSLLPRLPGLPKLKILVVPNSLKGETSRIVEKAPQLETLVFNNIKRGGTRGGFSIPIAAFGGGGFGAPNPPPFGGLHPIDLFVPNPFGGGGFGYNPGAPQVHLQMEGNTLVTDNETLLSFDLSVIKRVGHILKRSNYDQYFVRHDGESLSLTEPLMHYLFKVLKLDINLSPKKRNPFSVELFQELAPWLNGFPIAYALRDAELTQLMLNFGADPNYPEENMTPFARSDISKKSAILLLERGADPLKTVGGKAAISHLFPFLRIELLKVITTVLNKGVDPNQLMSESTTLIDLAVEYGKELTLIELVKRGALWTPKAMAKLIHSNIQLWKQVISDGDFDTKKLFLSTALVAIKKDCYDIVRDYINNMPRDLDSSGFGLVHYLVLLSQNTPNKREDGFAGVNDLPPQTTTPPTPESIALLKQMIKDFALDVNLKTSNGETSLQLICQDNEMTDEGVVQVLIEAGTDVNEPDASGWTSLHAALFRNRSVAGLLLSNGANINAQDSIGITPLMALLLGSEELIESAAWDACLKHGFDVNVAEKYLHRSILHYMAARNHREFLSQLLEKEPGIDVDCRDIHGFTPLHYAASGGHYRVMEILMKHGADTNATTNTLKLTPLLALASAHSKTAPYHDYLPSYTGDTWQLVSVFAGPASPALLCTICKSSWSHVTAKRYVSGFENSFALPLGESIPWPTDLTITDQFGNNALHGLVWGEFNNLISDNWTAPNGLVNLWSTPNKHGTTPFHAFVRNFLKHMGSSGKEDLSNYFSKHRDQIVYSLNNRDEYGITGLEYVFESPSNSWAQTFIHAIPGVNFTSQIVQVPSVSLIHKAVKSNMFDKVLFAKIHESDPNALNVQINGQTPLHLFVRRLFCVDLLDGDVKLDLFLDLKVNLDVQDNYGNTVLHYACFFFSLAAWDKYNKRDPLSNAKFCTVLFKLIEAGARLDIKNNDGQAPIDIIPNLLELDRSLLRLIEARRKEDIPAPIALRQTKF